MGFRFLHDIVMLIRGDMFVSSFENNKKDINSIMEGTCTGLYMQFSDITIAYD